MKDVMEDAYHNFMPIYQDYVLHKATGTEKFRAKVIHLNSLESNPRFST